MVTEITKNPEHIAHSNILLNVFGMLFELIIKTSINRDDRDAESVLEIKK